MNTHYDEFLNWPKISVITPSFNQGLYLEETIRSVLMQKYPNLEYFIVDGGSSDNSIEIIKKYEKYITKWISEKDNGQSDALNKAFKWCNGDLICFINSDDIFLKDAFFKIAKKYLQTEYSDISIFSGNVVFVNKNSIPSPAQHKSYFPFNTPTDLTLIDHINWFLPQPPMFFIKRMIERTGFFVREDLHYQMDRELIYRLLKIGKLELIDENIATYRVHDESKTGGRNILDSYLETEKAFKSFFSGNKKEDKIRKKVMNARMAVGFMHVARKESEGLKSIPWFIKSAYFNPHYLKTKCFWVALIKVFVINPLKPQINK